MVVESNSIVTNPTISICILCYNHQDYIEKCLDSALNQKTDFAYEIVLGDDCSTDRSVDICVEYQKRYPKKIRLFLNETNQGLIRNYVNLLSQCRGSFIAICAGDDYWCDENKLQKQVSFLSNHPDYSMCFTNAFVESINNGVTKRREVFSDTFGNLGEDKEYSGVEVALKRTIPASSVIFRNGLFDPIILLNREYYAEDMIVYLLLNQYGKLFGMSDITTVYVLHEGSITATKQSTPIHLYQCKTTFKSIDLELNRKYHPIIANILSIEFYKAAKNEFKRGSKRLSIKYFIEAVSINPVSVFRQLWKSIIY